MAFASAGSTAFALKVAKGEPKGFGTPFTERAKFVNRMATIDILTSFAITASVLLFILPGIGAAVKSLLYVSTAYTVDHEKAGSIDSMKAS